MEAPVVAKESETWTLRRVSRVRAWFVLVVRLSYLGLVAVSLSPNRSRMARKIASASARRAGQNGHFIRWKMDFG